MLEKSQKMYNSPSLSFSVKKRMFEGVCPFKKRQNPFPLREGAGDG
jgi:hypothetical protein